MKNILNDSTTWGAEAGKINENFVDNHLNAFSIEISGNLQDPDYVEPSNPLAFEKGGTNRLVDVNGNVTTATNWYASPLIPWGNNTKVQMSNCRSWAQYAADGVTKISSYYPAAAETLYFEKAEGAVYFRISCIASSLNTVSSRSNFGETLTDYKVHRKLISSKRYGGSPVFFNSHLSEVELFKAMLIGEMYLLRNVTYTNNLINSPFNVNWPDGGTGTITLTRDTSDNVTQIVATKTKYNITLTLTQVITRDASGNITNITIS